MRPTMPATAPIAMPTIAPVEIPGLLPLDEPTAAPAAAPLDALDEAGCDATAECGVEVPLAGDEEDADTASSFRHDESLPWTTQNRAELAEVPEGSLTRPWR